MRQNINTQHLQQEEFLNENNEESAALSKSKQLLKKCISEIGSTKEGKTPSHHFSNIINNEKMGAQLHNKIKIAAPKPIRARPLGLTHVTSTSKWLETSPVKCESDDIFGQQEEKICQSDQKDTSNKFAEFLKMPKLNFQIEQNLSYDDDIQNHNNTSQNSELRSIMEAEQELTEIFSRSKLREQNFSIGASSHLGFSSQWSPEKNAANFRQSNILNNSNTNNLLQPDYFSVGFSKFGHFKAPIKRPTCNPIIKDERFKRLNNNVNEVNQSCINNLNHMNTQDTLMTDCNSQDVINNPYNQNQNQFMNLQDLDSYDQSQYMFAFSQTTSPTGYSSRLHPINSQMDHSGLYTSNFQKSINNLSWYNQNNQSVNHQAHVNSHIPFNDLYTQQMQIQSQTHYNLQAAHYANQNQSNSAPEYQNSYLNMFSQHNIQPVYPTYECGLVSGEHQLQEPSSQLMNQVSYGLNNQQFQENMAPYQQFEESQFFYGNKYPQQEEEQQQNQTEIVHNQNQ